MALVAEAKSSALSALGALVREHDRDRFVTTLYAPEDRRESLFTLYAFNYELAKVRESVREPDMGRIRLQWWRDAVAAIADGNAPPPHEVAEPLGRVIRNHHLSRAVIDRMINVRELDLLADPPNSLAELEDYADATGGALNTLALKILAVRDEKGAALTAARQIGIAYALAGLLRATRFHGRFGRSFVPIQLDPGRHALGLQTTPRLREAVATIVGAAYDRLEKAQALQEEVNPAALPVLLPAVLADRWLAQIERADFDVFAARVLRRDPWRDLRLYFAARRGRI